MNFKKTLLSVLALASFTTLTACGNNNTQKEDGKTAQADEIITKLDKETEVTFWHAMSGPQEEALKGIVEDFMKQNKEVKVTLQNQTSYPDLQAKLNATMQSPKDLPTISQAYPGWLYNVAEDKQLVDLAPYIKNEEIGWKEQEPIRETLLNGAKINDIQYGIPFNKSTEVLFYNEDLLKEYNIEVPKTKEAFEINAKEIFEKSSGEVVGAGFDSLSNYYIIGMKDNGVEFNKELALDSEDSKDVIGYYGKGIEEGYFRTAGSDGYLSGPFANKKIAMYIGSSAGEAYTAKDTKGKFTYGVSAPPTQNNIQQGTDIYMFNSATPEERTAAFTFMKYLASPEAQLNWALATGYIPVVDSVIEETQYKNSDMKVPAVVAEATKSLFYMPAEENSDAASNELRVILENIYANPYKEESKLIEQSTSQLQQAWEQ